jgi:hypothetical protein
MYGIPYALLGARLAGDLGGVTCYTDRDGRKTVYPIAPPKHPASPSQAAIRTRFAAAVGLYKALTATEKANLELATQKTSLCLTGQNLYISACLRGQNDQLQAIATQTGLALPAAPDLRGT